MNRILNVAAGKFTPLDLKNYEPVFVVNVDTMYYYNTTPELIEKNLLLWDGKNSKTSFVNADVFEFMERTLIKFDRVCVYRFLEHVPMDKVAYFIYLLSTITSKGAEIDIIVPNYEILAKMILDEETNISLHGESDSNFEANNIVLTTELLNEPSCPHASVWTPWRCKRFFELEGRFKSKLTHSRYGFDGRDIYLRYIAERI